MNRELLEQALAALQHMINNTRAMSEYNPIIVIAAEDALKAELAKPEQATVPFPSFMRKRIEEAIDNAINPKGMSTHDGKATVLASDLQRMLLVVDLAAQQLAKPDSQHGNDKEDSQMEITVKRKTIYGNEVVYPVCDTAVCLTMLGDTKTITPRQIGIIKALGYKIVLEQQEEL